MRYARLFSHQPEQKAREVSEKMGLELGLRMQLQHFPSTSRSRENGVCCLPDPTSGLAGQALERGLERLCHGCLGQGEIAQATKCGAVSECCFAYHRGTDIELTFKIPV